MRRRNPTSHYITAQQEWSPTRERTPKQAGSTAEGSGLVALGVQRQTDLQKAPRPAPQELCSRSQTGSTRKPETLQNKSQKARTTKIAAMNN